jgi:TRAF3-interacting protein 1
MEELIAEVQAKIGSLIQKPKMTDKLLSKPPFRFLHDLISAVTATTGFGEGYLIIHDHFTFYNVSY